MNTQGNTSMAHRKTAIALPEDILEEVDRAARERGESRSLETMRGLCLKLLAKTRSLPSHRAAA
jgi:metal-responsive CopG/Arc/MetJ family transcriptional regulator